MADMGNDVVNMTQPTIPLFKGENYEFWSIKMKTLFKSHGIWELVENRAANTPEDQKKDAKVLFFIQQAVHQTVFSKITAAKSAKEAWTTLKTAFQGNSKVIAIKLQGLRRDFETLNMNHGETVQIFLSRVSGVVNQIRGLGEEILEKTIVAKVLRSLLTKFDHVVAAIEESKDLETYTFDELMGSLQTHEARLSRSEERVEEKTFYTKGENSRGKNNDGGHGRGRGNGRGSRGRGGRGRGRGRTGGADNQLDSKSKKNVQCYYCNRYGHYRAECYKKKRDEEQASYVEEKKEEQKLLMAFTQNQTDASRIWFLDSGCSNHMTGLKHLFKELDENYKLDVKFGNDKKMQVEGKGTIAIQTKKNGMKFLQDVYFIPELTQNLLSIGQLMKNGYKILFERDVCTIRDGSSNQILSETKMASNKLFPMEIADVKERVMAVKELNQTELWHLRYGHLNINVLKLLNQKNMVYGLPELGELGLCEACVYGKQSKLAFPKDKAKRVTRLLELVHTDLCGPMETPSFGGSKYFLLFIDDFSRMSWVYFLQNKSETFNCFTKFKAYVEKQTGEKLKKLRSDRGGEYMSAEFKTFCEKEGIHHELTTFYTPQ
jgi:gag-polypeptide of LTR copia-type/Integrase core domain/GAG-pre-integrase domain